jgi:tripartite-type tricarboxylate transporter receptor subunit TctC
MTRLRAACIIAVLAAVLPSGISPADAQGFPSKTIRIIVPFTPGGSNDVVAREIATGLQDSLKQTAVVENKPGGGGAIA